ncbi:tetratricopeptide repeat protein [Pedobacter panaciterrae]|uniref:tetratricopeptide repeat protein n=1 Tax=Pedobacter panaciterrae TaxID=363849 RepID=UPI0025989E08|nr:tetratricopeptide repeat protein [uncultured Pedobacter sp.]
MKHLLIIALILLSITSCNYAQQPANANSASPGKAISYEDWKKEAKTNIRLIPKFGNAVKSESQKKADQQLIDNYLKQQGSHHKASELIIKLGFDYLYKGDTKTAMYRFNQAWLLEPKNENVFWGFSAVYFTLGDHEKAMEQLNEGLSLNPNSSNLLTDKATIYYAKFPVSNDQKDLSAAIDLLNQSYKIDAKNQNTLFKLSVVYFMKQDCQNALRYYNECKTLGGRPITKEYTEAIQKQCR